MASGSRGDGSQKDIPRGLVNRTGTPLGRGSRLPSVRGQRDLTLGGIQRKVFTPNLSAKKKPQSATETPKSDSDQSTSASKNGEGRGRGRAERGRGRGRGRGEDRTIQLSSEFAYGPMGGSSSGWAKSSGYSGGGGGGGGGGSGGGGGGESSMVIKAAIRQSGTEEDKALLDTLLRDDFISDISSGDMNPIRLPLNLNSLGIKSEVKPKIKNEPMDEGDQKEEVADFSQTGRAPHSPVSLEEILFSLPKSEQGELLLLQFPDTMPGLPPMDVDDARPGTSTGNDSDELSKRLSACKLHDCPEGFMGKLRLRKSGKIELVLGENKMEVLSGIPVNFHQELVSVHTEDTLPQMVALGQVDHKVVFTPDYGHLINQTNMFS